MATPFGKWAGGQWAGRIAGESPGTGKVPFLPPGAAYAGVPTWADSLGCTLLVGAFSSIFYLKVLVQAGISALGLKC